MDFIERWQRELPSSLDEFARLAATIKGIDFTYGILAAGVLWPIRQPVREFDIDAADALRQLTGSHAGRLLKLVSALPDSHAPAARMLAEEATQSAELRAVLAALIERFGAIQLFAEKLARQYAPQADGNTFNITEQIKAALVNIGGITNIDTLSVQLNLPSPSTPVLSKRTRYLLGLVGIVLFASAALGIYQFALPYFATAPVMEGEFNIAVAKFGQLDSQGQTTLSDEASKVASAVYKSMDATLQAINTASSSASGSQVTVQPEVWSPDQTGGIAGRTPQERAQAAARLAAQIHADVIVYGNLTTAADGVQRFLPEFYLSSQKLSNAEELVGQYEFGTSIALATNITTNMTQAAQLRQHLQQRTTALAQFVVGLSNYAQALSLPTDRERQDLFDQARQHFQAAADTPAWDEQDGKEVVYIFLGNVVGQLSNIEQDQRAQLLVEATDYYTHALRINPEYARAQLGVAEALFQQARHECRAPIDAHQFQEAINAYRHAAQAHDQPIDGDIEVRIARGVGNIYFCLSVATNQDHYLEAAGEYDKVISAYESGDQATRERIHSYTETAYASKGAILTATAPTKGSGADDQRRSAIELFQKAIDLSKSNTQKGIYYSQIAFAYSRLKDYDHADAAYAQASELNPAKQAFYQQERDKLRKLRGSP